MDLLQSIRSDRARQGIKQPCRRDVFKTVSGIVKGYGLGEDFLKLLDEAGECPSRKGMEFAQVKAKRVFDVPPFALLSQEQYRLAMTIAGKLENPYLQFAHSPEEMLLSAPLYEADPSLGPEDLLRHDFETLLLYRRAKEELSELESGSGHVDGTVCQDEQMKEYGDLRSHPSFLKERIQQLQTFVARVETMESQPQ